MTQNTRKAVVTIAQVSEAFADYAEIRKFIGQPVAAHSFDKGPRGKGFAQYDGNDSVVRLFDSKEDALTFYGRYVEVAREVMAALGREVPVNAPEATSEASEGTVTGEPSEAAQGSEGDNSAPVPAQTRRRVKASA
jgi:hypothetical protein